MRKLTMVILLVSGLAAADTSTKEPTKKAKAGQACKADADCDQSGRQLRCSDSKCAAVLVHPVT